MKLLIVNSNTSAGITDLLRQEALRMAAPGTDVTALTASFGPAAIETPAHVETAARATCEAITSVTGFDAAIVACFSDPGLMKARRAVPFPVVGLAEAAMFQACMLGSSFAVLTVAPSAVPGIHAVADGYGLGGRMTGVHALERGVLESHADPEGTLREMRALARQVVEAEAPDVLVLGGAITAGMATALAPDLPVPLLDGLRCALRQAEMLTR